MKVFTVVSGIGSWEEGSPVSTNSFCDGVFLKEEDAVKCLIETKDAFVASLNEENKDRVEDDQDELECKVYGSAEGSYFEIDIFDSCGAADREIYISLEEKEVK